MNKEHESVISIALIYFGNKAVVTPDEIRQFLETAKPMFPDVELNTDWLFNKLESLYAVSTGIADILDNRVDHEEWFNPSTNALINQNVTEWHFWEHYKLYLIRKGWPVSVINSMDSLSSEILSRTEDPSRSGKWDRRGMVMGSVQSGKTANYTALITKAADTGYKFFIILAGVHNSLRSQTQTRLNEEFLGYDIERAQMLTGAERAIGVRALFPEHRTVYTLTSSNEAGDFSRNIADQSGIPLSREGPPIVLVIKKNVAILRNLINWLRNIACDYTEDEKWHIPDIPTLIIDDECDYASVNTRWPERDERGQINREWDPTTTNRKIRQIVKMFDKVAYIGYTATPYANIFIDAESETHPIYGEDLFPRSFIISLPAPSNYLGPEKVFGLSGDSERDIEETDPLPLIRVVNDHEESIPDKHKKDLDPPHLPDSMKYAIKCFILSCAARSLRREGTPHNSMLIHITRFTAVQDLIYEMVKDELRGLMARIMSGENLNDFKDIWESDYLPTTSKMAKHNPPFTDAVSHTWDEIKAKLVETTRFIRINKINGTSTDYLAYKEIEMQAQNQACGGNVPWEEKGLSVIVIGGDKLSRGLTLEGLSVSYYLRASRMYDTLMQMGRWFGYRDGYSDLCRIFTTGELVSWYRHIASATLELREELNYMASLRKTPVECGLKVRSHPGRLVVTSAGKRRNAEIISLSYDGRISETIVFDRQYTHDNFEALEKMVDEIGRPADNEVDVKSPRYIWNNVPPEIIINFLSRYKQQEEAMRTVKASVLSRYIEEQSRNGELVKWCVVLVSKHDTENIVNVSGYEVGCVYRKPFPDGSLSGSAISIGRLVNPRDETLDLSAEELEKARDYDRERGMGKTGNFDPSGLGVRNKGRPKERGLLLIYLPHGKDDVSDKEYGCQADPVVGFAVSFPRSANSRPIDYLVNTVYSEHGEL